MVVEKKKCAGAISSFVHVADKVIPKGENWRYALQKAYPQSILFTVSAEETGAREFWKALPLVFYPPRLTWARGSVASVEADLFSLLDEKKRHIRQLQVLHIGRSRSIDKKPC